MPQEPARMIDLRVAGRIRERRLCVGTTSTTTPKPWEPMMIGKVAQAFWATSQRLQRDDRGATAVLVAVTATVLLAFTGLSVDAGWWYTLHRQNQSAADAAALSAAYAVLDNPTWT